MKSITTSALDVRKNISDVFIFPILL